MKTRSVILLSLLLAALAMAPAAGAEQPLGPAEYTSVEELALVIAGYFPKVRGAVTAVKNGTITIDRGRKDGIVPNMVLSLWREGKELLHPVTKTVIGRAEDEVGTIEITSAAEDSATAMMKRQVLPPRAGDRARMTPRKINIAVVPLKSDRPEIIEGLVERLGGLGRFTVLEPPKVAAFMQQRKQRDASLVREMGTAFALDAVVTLAILPSEEKHLVTARIFYADEEQPLDTIVATLNLATKRAALGDIRPFFAPLSEQKALGSRMPDLPTDVRYLAVADVDGDGGMEFVFSDARSVAAYRLSDGGWTSVGAEEPLSEERRQQQIWIDAADINGNGRAEIFVTRMLNGVVSSYALELERGAFRRVADVPGFLRVVPLPGRGPVLAGQDYSRERLFEGQPKEYRWSEGSYAASAAISVPDGVPLYGFTIANLGEDQPLFAAYDRDEHIVIYAAGTPLWKSEEEYVSVATKIVKPLTGLDAVLGKEATVFDRNFDTASARNERLRTVRLPARILSADISGKGVDDVIVAKNKSGSFLGGFSGGEMHGLSWTGARLNPRWSVKELPGMVLDIAVAAAGNGRFVAYGLVKESGGLFKKDKYWLEKYESR